jgi:ABC-type amino acid transport substrate-binding protein
MNPISRRALLGTVATGTLMLGGSPLWAQTELTDLAKIQANGTLKVAVYKANPPFSDGQAAAMQGLDVALAEALAKTLGLKLALLPFDAGENMNDDLRNMVWRGHYLGYGPADVLMHVPVDKHLMDENRQVIVLAPYVRESLVLLHDSSRLGDVRSPQDLQGLPLAAERGSGAASVLMGYGSGLLRSQVAIFDTGVLAAQAVVDGKAAAAYVSRAQAEAVVFKAGQQGKALRISALQLPGLPPQGWPVGMAIKSQHKQLGRALEGALQTLRANGELQAMFRQLGLTLAAP